MTTANIISIGTSKGIRIPKNIIEHFGFDKVSLEILKDGLLVNLLINEKVVSKLREKAGSEVDLFDLVSHFSRIWSITEQRA